ncbi:MAG: hypothetical protein AAF368_10555 [Planctomycetota bacterium]
MRLLRDAPSEWAGRWVPFGLVAERAGVNCAAVSRAVNRRAAVIMTIPAVGATKKTHLAMLATCGRFEPPRPSKEQIETLSDPLSSPHGQNVLGTTLAENSCDQKHSRTRRPRTEALQDMTAQAANTVVCGDKQDAKQANQ